MANGEMLTIKDLFELHLAGARLATLSACETGLPGARIVANYAHRWALRL